MSSFTNYLEDNTLDHIFGGPDYTRPGTLHVGLYTSATDDAGGGTEVTGGSYARAAVTNDATQWPASSGGSKSNGQDISFPTPTANWGTVTHSAILDANSGGNMLVQGALTASKTIETSDDVTFLTGSIVITLD